MSALAYVATGFIIFVIGVWVGQSLAFHVMRKHWLNQARRTEEAEAKLAEAERAVDAARRAEEGQLADWWDRYWASRSE